jgi:hypothetical protein
LQDLAYKINPFIYKIVKQSNFIFLKTNLDIVQYQDPFKDNEKIKKILNLDGNCLQYFQSIFTFEMQEIAIKNNPLALFYANEQFKREN